MSEEELINKKDMGGSGCGQSLYYLGLCNVGLKKTTRHFRQDSPCHGSDSNLPTTSTECYPSVRLSQR
jgi:hypothetical protein